MHLAPEAILLPALLTSWSRCTSLEGRVGGTWSRKACCFSCLREGAYLYRTGPAVATPGTGPGAKPGTLLPRQAQSHTALTGHCRCR